eukprot:jgi/Mesvir1/28286/Mv04809-RA.1
MVKVLQKEVESPDRREIGGLAVWSVTSAKPGNGVELLRDGNVDTYWQSDGAQPHLVNIQFQRKVCITEISVYADYKKDESYTPSKISIRGGNSLVDLREIKLVEVEQPVGWIEIPLAPNDSTESFRAFFLQLAILSNHQNGRDTHIRQIKVYGPRQDFGKAMGLPLQATSPEFRMVETIR